MPIALSLLSVIGWWIISIKKGIKLKNYKAKIISSIVILLFFVHPNIIQLVFETFYCLDIDGEQRLKYDLDIKCYKGSHYYWAYGVAIPGMIVWGFGIPLFAFFLLFREQDKIDKIEVR